jgi:ATP-dependent Zn protease
MPDPDDAEDAAEARQHERASTVEDILSDVREDLGRQSYPTTSEDLAATYAGSLIGLPNETESLGSAFDRMDDRFEDAEEAYEALLTEFEGGDSAGTAAVETPAERATWSGDRVDEERAPADEEIEGERQQSVERAKQAQQEEYEERDGDDGG